MSTLFEKKFFTRGQYQRVADVFGLGSVQKFFHFDTHGFESSKTMLETSRGTFIVSIHRLPKKGDKVGKSRSSIQYEIELTNKLKGLPVPRYIQSASNEFIVHMFGAMVTVYRYLPGHPQKKITPKMAYQLGAFLGKFHQLGKRFRGVLRGRRKFYDLPPAVVATMDRYARRQTHPLLKAAVRECRDGVLRNRLPKGIPSGPIHVDVKPENELFTGEKLTGVIDFGIFYRDALLIDVGKTVMWNCCRGSTIDQRLFSSFMKGYLSKRKLTPTERSLLQQAILFGIYAHVYVDLYHIPLKRVPESYTLSLVKTFLPVARWLEKNEIRI